MKPELRIEYPDGTIRDIDPPNFPGARYDADYIARRNRLIPIASKIASEEVAGGESLRNGSAKRAQWEKVFTREMERLTSTI